MDGYQECSPNSVSRFILIDVLRTWERQKKDLRLLCVAALSVFLVPASSSPVERVFSEGGIVMRSHRSRMGAKHLEKIMFLKCNMDKF